jgi:hypothetical protein
MSKNNILVVLLLILCCCNSVRAPRHSVPKRIDLDREAFGGWIGVRHAKSGLVQGELIAVTNDSVFIMESAGLQSLARTDIDSARVILFNTSEGSYGLWTFVGSLATISHGLFLVFTLPATLIAGIATTVNEANRINYVDYPATPWEKLHRYARLPQGIPDGARGELKPRAVSKWK